VGLFLGIASIKRLQGLYQGTLVAQGAFSIYKTDDLLKAGGWPDAIGEDIILTWNLLNQGVKIYYEPLSAAFTEVPASLGAFSRQRSRWARGMIEALKLFKPWNQPLVYIKYLTGIDFIMPYLDFCYAFLWLPGLVLAFFGVYWIVGLMTLLVLPLTLLFYGIQYVYQRRVFRRLKLGVRKNVWGFILYVLIYQFIMSPVAVWGYAQELFGLKRKWK
jgi:Glycosyltransferases, probably involved in cell wall biogenesis